MRTYLTECPARTGVPVAEKRCTVHVNRGAHECYAAVDTRSHDVHWQHVCRCGYTWLCATNEPWSASKFSPAGRRQRGLGAGEPQDESYYGSY